MFLACERRESRVRAAKTWRKRRILKERRAQAGRTLNSRCVAQRTPGAARRPRGNSRRTLVKRDARRTSMPNVGGP